jgi:putative endonuclease
VQKPELGKLGEAMAVEFLQRSGYRILDTNRRFGRYELDIVAQIKQSLVFVEVKTRSAENFDFPESSVEHKKQKSMISAASSYIAEKGWEGPIRFDIISIVMLNHVKKITHFRDAFFPLSSR